MKNTTKENSSPWTEILDYCQKETLFLGEGNPDSKILLIGKEPGFNQTENKQLIASNEPLKFIEKISKHSASCNLCRLKNDYKSYWLPRLINDIQKNATWCNYQRLIDKTEHTHPKRRSLTSIKMA